MIYADCRVMLNVIMLSVAMLNVMAPSQIFVAKKKSVYSDWKTSANLYRRHV